MGTEDALHRKLRPESLRLSQNIALHQVVAFVLGPGDEKGLPDLVVAGPSSSTRHLFVFQYRNWVVSVSRLIPSVVVDNHHPSGQVYPKGQRGSSS